MEPESPHRASDHAPRALSRPPIVCVCVCVFYFLQERVSRGEHDLGSGQGHRAPSRAPQDRELARLWGILGACASCCPIIGTICISSFRAGLDAFSGLCASKCPLLRGSDRISPDVCSARKSHPDRVKSLVLRSAHFPPLHQTSFADQKAFPVAYLPCERG